MLPFISQDYKMPLIYGHWIKWYEFNEFDQVLRGKERESKQGSKNVKSNLNTNSNPGQHAIQQANTLEGRLETRNMNPCVSIPTDLDTGKDAKPHTLHFTGDSRDWRGIS